MSRIIVIVGATATGKTLLSIKLAQEYNAVIINADSTQVYKEPIIATAKITDEEKENIKHYMFDIVSLNDDYTIFDYQKQGRNLIDKFIKEDKNIIIVGGSGLYLKALLYDYELNETENIHIDFSNCSNEELKQLANNIDENNNIHINNRQRLERYITYYNQTGKTIIKSNNINNKKYNFDIIGLSSPRNILYDKINNRVDVMFSNGLLEEAKSLKKLNLKHFNNIIGYRELNMYFDKKISLEEAKELIKKNTRHYAKRQITWFKNQMSDIVWFDVNYDNFNKTITEIKKYLS